MRTTRPTPFSIAAIVTTAMSLGHLASATAQSSDLESAEAQGGATEEYVAEQYGAEQYGAEQYGAEQYVASVTNAVAAPLHLRGDFAFSMAVRPGTHDGHVAGHPGRVAVLVEDRQWVFRVGGDKPIAGIFRDSFEIAIPITTDDWVDVSASMDSDGVMTLAVDRNGHRRVVRGQADVAVLEQLDMMETYVGGVVCSDILFVGTSAEECGDAFDGDVEAFEFHPRATVTAAPEPVGC